MNYKTDYDWTDLTDEPVNETYGTKMLTQEEAKMVASKFGMTSHFKLFGHWFIF